MINLTPHTITLRTPEGDVTIPPSGQLARVSTAETVVGTVLGVQVVERRFFEVEGLPPEGTPCLVSALVLSACPGRAGVYAPDSGPTAIREGGQVVAVTRLVAA